MSRVLEGGWIEKLKRPARARHDQFDHRVSTLQAGIRQIDQWLHAKEPEMYAQLQRAHSGPASPKDIAYLKRKKVSANWSALTKETAMILRDYSVVQPKLAGFDLPTD